MVVLKYFERIWCATEGSFFYREEAVFTAWMTCPNGHAAQDHAVYDVLED